MNCEGVENMNDQNLIRITKENAVSTGRRGGVASGKARREKKTMREILRMLCGMPCNDEEILQAMKGVKGQITNGAALAWSMIYHARRGNSQMARLVLETMGEDASIVLREKELDARLGGNDEQESTIIILPAKDIPE